MMLGPTHGDAQRCAHVVRMLEAKLAGDLEQKVKQQVGWKQVENRWIGVRVAKKMQNPQYLGGVPGTLIG